MGSCHFGLKRRRLLCYCCHTKRSICKMSEVILLQPGGIILWAVDVSLQEVLCLGTFYFVDSAHGRCVVRGQICDSGPVVLCLYWASASSHYSPSPPWVAPRTSALCGSGWWSHLIRLPLNLVLKWLLQVLFFQTHFFSTCFLALLLNWVWFAAVLNSFYKPNFRCIHIPMSAI